MTPFDEYPEFNEKIKNLNKMNDFVYEFLERINNCKLPEQDKIFCTAIVDRTINLNQAILNSISDWNVTAAGVLLRTLLDNLIVSVFVLKNDKKDDLMVSFLKNGRICESNGKPIRDSEMKNFSNKIIIGIDRIYNDTCGYIHFSSRHCYNCVTDPTDMKLKVGLGYKKWPKENIENMLNTVEKITFNIFKVIGEETSGHI